MRTVPALEQRLLVSMPPEQALWQRILELELLDVPVAILEDDRSLHTDRLAQQPHNGAGYSAVEASTGSRVSLERMSGRPASRSA